MKRSKGKRGAAVLLAAGLLVLPAAGKAARQTAGAEESLFQESMSEEDLLSEEESVGRIEEAGGLILEADEGQEEPLESVEEFAGSNGAAAWDADALIEAQTEYGTFEEPLAGMFVWAEPDTEEELTDSSPSFSYEHASYAGFDDAADESRARLIADQIQSIYLTNIGVGDDDSNEYKDYVPYSFTDPDTGKTFNFCGGLASQGDWRNAEESKNGWYHQWAFTRERSIRFNLKDGTSTGEFRAYCVEPGAVNPLDGTYAYGGILAGNFAFDKSKLTAKRFYVLNTDGTDMAARLSRAMYYLYGGPAWGETISGINMKAEIEKYLSASERKDSYYWAMTHYVMSYIYNPSDTVFNRWCGQLAVADKRTMGNVRVGTSASTDWNWLKEENQFTAEGKAVFRKLAAKLESLPMPETLLRKSGADTEKNSYSASYDNEKHSFVSEQITYAALKENTAVIQLADSETLVLSDGTRKTGKVSIAGGTSFHIESSNAAAAGTTKAFTLQCRYDTDMVPILLVQKDDRQDVICSYHKSKRLSFSVTFPKVGYVQLVKESALPDVTAANAQYSLLKASYGIYAEQSCKTLLDTLTTTTEVATGTTEDGRSITQGRSSVSRPLAAGTYYAKELQAPANYEKNGSVITVKVTAQHTEKAPAVFKASDTPVLGMKTTASGAAGSSHYVASQKNQTVADTVQMENLGAKTTYFLAGVVTDETTGKVLAGVLGDSFHGPSAAGETLKVTMKFSGLDLSGCEGHTLLISEYLLLEKNRSLAAGLFGKNQYDLKEIAICRHASDNMTEAEKKQQRLYAAKITTSAVCSDTDSKQIPAEGTVHVTDTVSYQNLDPNQTYTLKGELFVTDGKQVTRLMSGTSPAAAVQTFKPDQSGSGRVNVSFTFQTAALDGKTLTVYEELYAGEKEGQMSLTAVHKDMNDTQQQLYAPVLATVVKDPADGSGTNTHIMNADEKMMIQDTVQMHHLIKGETYELRGGLVREDGVNAAGRILKMAAGSGCSLVPVEDHSEGFFFKAESVDASVIVTFEAEGAVCCGSVVTAVEYLYAEKNSTLLAAHDVLDDPQQMLYVPQISTQASDIRTGTKAAGSQEDILIEDLVQMKGLMPNTTYWLTGGIWDQKSGEKLPAVMIDESGEEISYTVFTSAKTAAEQKVRWRLPAEHKEGCTLIAGATLLTGQSGKCVAEHLDLTDEKQSIYVPSVSTKAADAASGTNHVLAENEAVITDEVSCSNLVPGLTYTLRGELHNQKTGEQIPSVMLDEDGAEIDSFSFTVPEDTESGEGGADIKQTIRLRFDAEAVQGNSAVIFEYLSLDTELLVKHEDLEDPNQTVYIPSITTQVKGDASRTQLCAAGEKIEFTDIAKISGLEAGRTYRISGMVRKRTRLEDGSFSGEEIEHILTGGSLAGTNEELEITDKGVRFTAHQANEVLEIHYSVNGRNLAGGELSIGEILELETTAEAESGSADEAENQAEEMWVITAVHNDLQDEPQIIYIPAVSTCALAKDTMLHEMQAAGTAQIIDTVHYKQLIPGLRYRMAGTLHCRETGEAVCNADKEPVTAFAEFTPDQAEGDIELTFTADTTDLIGKTVVVFETCMLLPVDEEEASENMSEWQENTEPEARENLIIAEHCDLEDEEQAVHILNIRTNALGKVSGTHEQQVSKECTIIDTVTYEGLQPQTNYTVSGRLIDQETGKPLQVNGTDYEVHVPLVPAEASGSVELSFTVNAEALAGKTVVAFEKLYAGETEAASHEDLQDAAQSIRLIDISTKLSGINGEKQTTGNEETALTDEVSYKGLTAGRAYRLKGVLMDQEKKAETGITADVVFTPEAETGSVTIPFKLDTRKYAGRHLVAFERLYDEDGNQIAAHEDLEDAEQMIHILSSAGTTKETEEKSSSGTKSNTTNQTEKSVQDTVSSSGSSGTGMVKTGDDSSIELYLLLAALSLGAAAAGAAYLKKKHQSQG